MSTLSSVTDGQLCEDGGSTPGCPPKLVVQTSSSQAVVAVTPVRLVTENGAGATVTMRQSTQVVLGGAQAPSVLVSNAAQRVLATGGQQGVQGVPGPKGDRGPQGVPGPPGSDVVAGTAAEALGGHRMVRGARDALTYATNTDASHADDIQGLTLGAAAAGAGVLLQRAGDVAEPSWSWTPETPVFLGPNGQLTQTPPDDSAAFTLCVGFAATPTTLVLRFEAPIYNED